MDGLVSSPRFTLGTVQWGLPYGIANRAGMPAESTVARMLARARVRSDDAGHGAGIR